MSVQVRVRKRDGAHVFYIRYWADGVEVLEKVCSVPASRAKVRALAAARTQALTALEDRRTEIDAGIWVHPRERRAAAKLTFGQLVERFLAEYRPRSGDLSYYRDRSDVWLAHIPKDRPVSKIRPADVEAFRDRRLRAKVSPSTVRKDLISLNTLFRWAVGRDLVERSPADPRRVRRPSEPRHRTDYLSEDQEAQLLRAAPAWLRLVLRWAIGTGMDREEILTLDPRDVDEKAGIVHATRGKTGIPRQIPLDVTPGLREVLKAARRVQGVGARHRVFLGPEGKPITVDLARNALGRAYRKAEIPVSAPWKILRHTFASRLTMAGVPLVVTARLMGHSTQATTERYGHLSPEYLRDTLARAKKSRRGQRSRATRGSRSKSPSEPGPEPGPFHGESS